MIKIVIIVCIAALIMLFTGYIASSIEAKDFNDGKCPNCNKKLKHFDTDSQGGRGYCCRECGYYTWVSYKTVDKKFLKENN